MLTVGNETCLSGGAAGSAGSRIITNDMDVPIDIVSITGTGGADGYTVTSTAIGSTVAPDESFDISYALDGAGCPEAGAFVFETDCCGSFTFTI